MNRGLTEDGPGYREFVPAVALRPHVSALWVREAAEPDGYSTVVPDGCMDIVWLANGGLLIAGPSTQPIEALATTAGSSAGVRFKPGIAPSLLKAPADTFRDAHLTLDAFWPREARRLSEVADGASDPSVKLGLMLQAIAGRLQNAQPDALVQDAIALMRQDGSTTIEALSDTLDISHRHLLRGFTSQVGYGPKMLQRILRFRKSLKLLRITPGAVLADVALSSGYADHAHMTREFVQLSGIAPHEVQRPARSDSFKPRLRRLPYAESSLAG